MVPILCGSPITLYTPYSSLATPIWYHRTFIAHINPDLPQLRSEVTFTWAHHKHIYIYNLGLLIFTHVWHPDIYHLLKECVLAILSHWMLLELYWKKIYKNSTKFLIKCFILECACFREWFCHHMYFSNKELDPLSWILFVLYLHYQLWIIWKGVSGFATGSPCGVYCSGWTVAVWQLVCKFVVFMRNDNDFVYGHICHFIQYFVLSFL